ncbi:type II toxin-antitoxin system RelE/ParE family toxin [Arvimicrobium flavum]|uniref:type II toxin-antitoxin system RelE/ParE family toxin n=1 Tax=Arvimicrobium flavum TaxID=3393320 RepID=UPI00237AB741|nr:type II toxin-antitoxin system RelE/ParE family toxin [Mesorhizobium shangrilense]
MKLKWLPKADSDLNRQIDYIADRNPAAAIDVLLTIRSAVVRLQEFAHSGRLGRQKGTREFPVVGTPFVVIYRVQNSTVQIMRVLHGAQRWPPRSH